MKRYTKTVRTGKFAKPGEDYKEGDLITIMNEGDEVEGQYSRQDVFKVKVPSGEELSLAFNKTSINNLIDAFGEEASSWVGKQVKVWRILQNVQGKMRKVTYVAHPNADIDEEGNFYVVAVEAGPAQAVARRTPVKKAQAEPVEEGPIPYPTEEINPEDITFD